MAKNVQKKWDEDRRVFTWDRQTQFQLDGLPVWAEDSEYLCWPWRCGRDSSETCFFLVMPAGKGNSGSPLGLGFGHLQDELTEPGGCHPGGTNCGI